MHFENNLFPPCEPEIFFDSNFHKKIISILRITIHRLLKLKNEIVINEVYPLLNRKISLTIVFLFLRLIQVASFPVFVFQAVLLG